MTKGGVIASPFSTVIASRRRGNPGEGENSKIKGQNDRAKFKNVVRGFSLVHDPEGSRYKRRVCLAISAEISSPLMGEE